MKKFYSFIQGRYIELFLLAAITLLYSDVLATKTFQPVFNPTLEVKRIGKAIKIDGDLNDPGWKNASQADNFIEQWPAEMTERFVIQYNNLSEKWEFDPLLTYRLGSFSVFYVGSTYDYNRLTIIPDDRSNWNLTNRQYFMKLQYMFRT